jgi:hypothetical protein
MLLSKEALDVLRSSTLEDDEKEVIMRRSSLAILKVTSLFAAKFLLIFLILYIIYFLSIQLFMVSEEDFIGSMLSPLIILAMAIVSMFYIWIRNGIKSDYSIIDRFLHRFAFSTPMLQKILSDFEDDLFRSKITSIESRNEVFVAGLPRAGTTLLLSLLYATGEFATFTYRQMPFILAPLLWNKISRPFQQPGENKERAHGNGMEVSFDSPEAFEEVIWLAYLKKKIVRQDYLLPLSKGEYTQEFADAIRNSVKKCILLEVDEKLAVESLRYLSKNNANISRIELLKELFPSSKILVPFRHPLSHISSLMKQHERFIEEHGQDSFSKKYMQWLGHFEFGDNFKPINFDGWLAEKTIPLVIDHNFWIQYWTAAYAYVLKHKDERIQLVDFEALLKSGEPILDNIANYIGLRDKSTLIAGAATLRSPTTRPFDADVCSTDHLDAANSVYDRLKDLSI